LTAIDAIGTVTPTCANQTGQGYASTYTDGNVTSRTSSGTTAALSYNNLNQMVEWNAGSTNQEWYLYDASGNRVLRRSTNSSGTTLTVYAFGLEEHLYSGTGTNQSNTYYYFLAGRLISDLNANSTYFLLTDVLGSVVLEINWSANSASVQANQLFGPYGNARYTANTLNTAKGFTGQYNDQLTGLDYYMSRYYDPVAGVFLSADKTQGNLQGLDPYGSPSLRVIWGRAPPWAR
jgi:RHS repeat-associated protein